MRQFIIQKDDADQRLDHFINKVTCRFSGPLLYKSIRKKAIKVNGKRTEPNYRLQIGDEVKLFINDEFFPQKDTPIFVTMQPEKLNIIYEDENIMLIDKRPGMLVHEDAKEKHDTLIQHVLATLYRRGEYKPETSASFVPALCNRIDKNTGGIVIAAKNAAAEKEMYKIIKTRQIEKFYLALVHGSLSPKAATLIAYHKKDSQKNQVKIFNEAAKDRKEIKTGYRVIKQGKNCSLVEVQLFTGRTHQIRAHFAHIGHPLVGDTKYGTAKNNSDFPFSYQALYSYKLHFKINDPSIKVLQYLNGKEFKVKDIYFQNYISS